MSPPAPPSGAADIPNRPIPAAAPQPRPEPTVSDDGILRPIQESDYFTLDPDAIRIISANIDQYFNQALDLFPFWETENKPDRFHVLFTRQIEERFPADEDIRGRIHGYGRRVFNALRVHVITKRLTQGLALVGFAAMAILGPGLFAEWTGGQPQGLGLAVLGMLITVGIFFGVSSILFVQYRFRLENDSYELSREVVQRTRELQNLFTNARALSDQAETQYATDGKGWGERALFLTRLVMWIAARMEYLEKFAQMELWRVRRERYWMRWVGRITTPFVLLVVGGRLRLLAGARRQRSGLPGLATGRPGHGRAGVVAVLLQLADADGGGEGQARRRWLGPIRLAGRRQHDRRPGAARQGTAGRIPRPYSRPLSE